MRRIALHISVVLCTYNRCDMLAKALESVASSRLPSAVEWEVVVVDNNSSDDTRDVAEEFCLRFPGRFRYVFEARQGKSYALNAGIQVSNGQVLAFMDDDVSVGPEWLDKLTEGVLQGSWCGAAGRVVPDRSFPYPRWFPTEERYLNGPLVMFDLGPDSGWLTESPLGVNMAFRREVFVRHGEFRVDLGPRPGSEVRGEDTEFCNRLLVAGETLRYEPRAVVYHAVPNNRLDKEYFLAWWFAKARTDIRASGVPPELTRRIAGIPLVYFRRFLLWTLRWLVSTHPGRRFTAKLTVWAVVGQICESYSSVSREAPPQL